MKNTFSNSVVVAASMILLAAGITTAFAHCGKCKTDAKYFAGALDDSKMTLAAAATLAEVETKGKAVHATVQRLETGVNVEVHCLVDGEIMAVVVDGKSGKVKNKSTVGDLEAHAAG